MMNRIGDKIASFRFWRQDYERPVSELAHKWDTDVAIGSPYFPFDQRSLLPGTQWMLQDLQGRDRELFAGDIVKNVYNSLSYLCVYSTKRLAWVLVPILTDIPPDDTYAGYVADMLYHIPDMYRISGDVFANPNLLPKSYIEKWFPYALQRKDWI